MCLSTYVGNSVFHCIGRSLSFILSCPALCLDVLRVFGAVLIVLRGWGGGMISRIGVSIGFFISAFSTVLIDF